MSQEFDDRYRVLRCIAVEGGVRTHRALETATQRPVLVHVMDDATEDDAARLRAAVARLRPAEQAQVLAFESIASGFAVVTADVPDLVSLPAWLAANVAEPGTRAMPAVHVIEQDEDADTRRPAPGEPAAHPPVTPTPQAPNAAPIEGEFTRLFAPIGRTAGGTPPSPRPAEPVLPAGTGDFTRAFAPVGAARLPADSSIGAATPVAAAPAAESPIAPVPPAIPPAVPPAVPAPSLRAEPPAPARPATPASPEPDGFTRAFGTPVIAPPRTSDASPLARPPAEPTWTADGASPGLPASPMLPPAPMHRPPPSADAGGATGAMRAHGTPTSPPPGARDRGFEPPVPLAVPRSPVVPVTPVGAPAHEPPPPPFPPASAASPVPGLSPFAPPASGAPLAFPAPPRMPGLPPVSGGGLGAHGQPESPYTEAIRQRVVPRAIPSPRPAAPAGGRVAPAAPARGIPMALVLVLFGVLLAAITLVIYLVVRPAPPGAASGGAPAPAAAAPTVPAPAAPSLPAPRAP